MHKQLTGDGSWTCFSEQYGQTFHSSHGAATESRQVFLQASGVQTRLQARKPTRVLEIGFGLGLNYLLTADLADRRRCSLHYQAFEHTLIDAQLFADLDYASLVTHQEIHQAVLGLFKSGHGGTVATRSSNGENCHNRLTLENCDFTESALPANHFHAVYMDAFSPDSNPECWSDQSFSRLFDCLVAGGILSTYSVKGSVRRALLAAGFSLEKLPGPPGKREILRATAKKQL